LLREQETQEAGRKKIQSLKQFSGAASRATGRKRLSARRERDGGDVEEQHTRAEPRSYIECFITPL
jgi:hypothetical protein